MTPLLDHLLDVLPSIDAWMQQVPLQQPKPDLPEPANVDLPSGISSKASMILGWAKIIVYVLASLGFMVAAAGLFFAHQTGASNVNTKALGWVVVGCIVAGGATGLADALIF